MEELFKELLIVNCYKKSLHRGNDIWLTTHDSVTHQVNHYRGIFKIAISGEIILMTTDRDEVIRYFTIHPTNVPDILNQQNSPK